MSLATMTDFSYKYDCKVSTSASQTVNTCSVCFDHGCATLTHSLPRSFLLSLPRALSRSLALSIYLSLSCFSLSPSLSPLSLSPWLSALSIAIERTLRTRSDCRAPPPPSPLTLSLSHTHTHVCVCVWCVCACGVCVCACGVCACVRLCVCLCACTSVRVWCSNSFVCFVVSCRVTVCSVLDSAYHGHNWSHNRSHAHLSQGVLSRVFCICVFCVLDFRSSWTHLGSTQPELVRVCVCVFILTEPKP